MIAVSALVTAVALTAVLIHKSHDTDDEKPVQHAKMTDAELRLERMYAQAHLSARAGRCEAVTAIGKKLSVDDPAEYARYSSDHELAVCLPSLQTAALR
ncbi:MAG TPA: hypothetical protein VMZ53_13435 [Kofleriaceae bacterium]|nr:hypothetical protein [Kofleriaceae bacterium]